MLLILVMVAVYGRVYEYGFLSWDDRQHVVDNPQLNPVTPSSVARFWYRPYWGLYIPLSYTFFAAEASIDRLPLPDGVRSTPNPIVFHLGSLALHVACVLLVFAILRRLFRHDGAALAGALFFGLHPIQVESVAWISETRGLLCAAFSLLAVWQYLAYVDAAEPQSASSSDGPAGTVDTADVASAGVTVHGSVGDWSIFRREDVFREKNVGRKHGPVPFRVVRRAVPSERLPAGSKSRRYALATAAFALALLCKPAAVAVPLIVGALDVGLLGRPLGRVWRPLVPWLILAAVWVVVTKQQQADSLIPVVAPVWARPLLAGDALAFYLVKVAAPLHLGPDYGRDPLWVMSQPWFYAAWLLPAAALAGLACLRHRRLWLTAAAISICWMLPVLGLVPFLYQRISTVADRYAYLALLGPALVLAWVLKHRWNRATIAATGTMLGLLAILSFVQTGYWRDDATFLAHALRVNPRSVVAKHNLGFLAAAEGRHAEAIRWYRDALADHPWDVELYLSLGTSLVAEGRSDEALQTTRDAVRRFPRDPRLRCKLGNILQQRGAIDEAAAQYRDALRLEADFPAAHLALGRICWDRGQADAAIEHYRRALAAEPDYVEAHVNLGAALQALHHTEEAQAQYEAALKLRPDWPAAHYNLANLLAGQGRTKEAIAHYQSALRFDPTHARAHVNLGIVLFEQKEVAAAIEHYRAALAIDPTLLPAYVNLGHALAAQGRRQEAADALQAALRLVPADSETARRVREILKAYGEQ